MSFPWYRCYASNGKVVIDLFPYEEGGAEYPLPVEMAQELAQAIARAVLEAKKQRKEQ